MTQPDEKQQHDQQLRAVATAQLANDPPAHTIVRPVNELQLDLQVHHIELEMQNEALRQALVALEESRDRYAYLYEFAPVGYLTLTADCTLAKINLTGTTLLGDDRKKLLNRHFTALVIDEDRDRWSRNFIRIKSGGKPSNVELAMQRSDGTLIHLQLHCTLAPDGLVGVALSDISERKKAEARLIESEANLRQLTNYLQQVREQDRVHFARELHDELGQNLTALRIDFNALTKDLKSEGSAVSARLADLDQMILGTVEAVRRIGEDLRPGILDDLGLAAALVSHVKRFTRQSGVPCDLSLDRDDYLLDEPVSTAIFRIVQESLTNIARHAKASQAMVSLQDRGDNLLLTIADDGCGLPAESTGERKNYGLLGMRERISMLGGSISIDSDPGRGTHIEVSIPWTKGADA